ncbi:TIGR03943 family protein [Micromonospora zhanjiangensis]
MLGGAVVKASVTEVYLRYVKQGLQPFLIGAGLLLVVAAVMTLWYDLRPKPVAPARSDTDEPGDSWPDSDDHGHHHGGTAHREPRVGWLLVLPVLGLLLVAPPALGSYAAGQAGSALAGKQASAYPPLPAGDPARVSVLDYASRAVFDKGVSIGDRTVQLTGFVATGPDGQPMLARIILSCCAADGRPIKVGLTGQVPTGVPVDHWIEVTGRYSPRTATDPVNDAPVPYLEVTAWREIPPPHQQYE